MLNIATICERSEAVSVFVSLNRNPEITSSYTLLVKGGKVLSFE